MTWMTPLLAPMSVLTTFAPLTLPLAVVDGNLDTLERKCAGSPRGKRQQSTQTHDSKRCGHGNFPGLIGAIRIGRGGSTTPRVPSRRGMRWIRSPSRRITALA